MKLIVLIGCLLVAVNARAQVTFDAFSSAHCNSTGCTVGNTVLTYAHTTGSGSNRQIATFVTVGCGGAESAPAVTSVTYAGVTMSQILSSNPASARRGYLYALPAGTQPTTGANNVVVTIASSIAACINDARLASGSISVAGVDQTTTFTSSNSNAATSTNPTVTLSSSGANDLVVHGACGGSSISAPTGTSRWNDNNGNTSCNSYGGATAVGGTLTLGWTMASDSFISLAASFKAAAASAPLGIAVKKKKLDQL